MKQFTWILAAYLLLAACNNKPAAKKDSAKEDTTVKSATTDTVPVPMVGNDRDEHGCIGSAGYTWSVVKNDCIRIFEAGKRLNAADAVPDKTTSAFAVFSADSKKAELFIPGQATGGILLDQVNQNKKWAAGTWSLEKTAKGLVLKKDGVVNYTE